MADDETTAGIVVEAPGRQPIAVRRHGRVIGDTPRLEIGVGSPAGLVLTLGEGELMGAPVTRRCVADDGSPIRCEAKRGEATPLDGCRPPC